MKTIFITSFHVFVSRNILSAPFFDLLKKSDDFKIVLIVPVKKKDFFEKWYGGKNVIVEGVERKLTRLDEVFKDLAAATIRTKSRSLMRRMNLGFERWYAQAIFFWAPLVKRHVPALYALVMPRDRYGYLFDKYRPDIVFATDVFSSVDIILMHEARRRKVRTVGMVRSWDNLIGKGGFRAMPDTLVVNSGIIKKDAMNIHAIPEKMIRVIGIPHYDTYLKGPTVSRSELLRLYGWGESARFVLFAPLGNRFFSKNDFDKGILKILLDIIPAQYKILVRCPPADTVDLGDFVTSERLVIERPGTHFGEGEKAIRDTEISPVDDEKLAASVAYAEVLVSGFTTLVVDAAILGTPTVLVNFDPVRTSYEESVNRHYEFEHMQPILKSGGVRTADSKERLVEFLNTYLKDRKLDEEGRKRIAQEQNFSLDGKSSERLLQALKDIS